MAIDQKQSVPVSDVEEIHRIVQVCTYTSTLPLSWLSTKQVCQRWSAHFAAFPTGKSDPK